MMNKERLLKLADFLETKVTDEHFDLNEYWTDKSCGAVGCALGWSGICFREDNEARTAEFKTGCGLWTLSNPSGFFNIDSIDVQILFYGDSQFGWEITRKQEIQLIRNFVKNGGIVIYDE